MKFRCERDVLDRALSIASRAAATRGASHQVFSGIHLNLAGDSLSVTGSDGDLTVRVVAQVGGQEDGVAVMPAKLAADIARALDSGQVEVEIGDDGASIGSGRSNFSLRTLASEEFPRFEPPAGDEVTLSAAGVAAALDQVVSAASGDDSRPILTGVLLAAEDDGLRFVATDSYRLAMRDLPGTSVLGRDQTVLVPSRALDVVGRLLGDADDLVVCLGEREAIFTVGDVQIVTRLIEGEYPNYRGLIPDDHPNSLIVARDDILDALRRVRLLATDNTPVRLAMGADGLELIAITQDIGQAQETVDATYEGEDLTVAFNPTYLIQGLEVCPDEELRLETCDALKPAVIRGTEDEDFLYLLMPVRVS